ncbi:FAD-dependent oxidoreductase [Furfurilactobacillus entadae]|uniref:FAD-dependent oxidoreductase n=1 Tax=Furfurilactobacillus entadae TaxID=2922307 RepID=UPI0035E89204
MRSAENVFIGFGKAAKTLAFKMAQRGESVIVIEANDRMYGGTCINVACIPSKLLYELSGRLILGGEATNYHQAIMQKRSVIGQLRYSNFHKLADLPPVTILNGSATFIDTHTVHVTYNNGTEEDIAGQRIFINTGSKQVMPDIDGIDSHFVTTSETLMEQDRLPKELVIIGGGYIALEFATTYSEFGSKVTILDRNHQFMPHDEPEFSDEIRADFNDRGITIISDATVNQIIDEQDRAAIYVSVAGEKRVIYADTILAATGRHANIDQLNLPAAGVKTNERGVIVDDHLHTNVRHIWALGDVRGGAQFTYISLDDHRIVLDELYGGGEKSLQEQKLVPHVLFVKPAYATIGLDEPTAKAQGIHYRVARFQVKGSPKAHILGNARGTYKALVDDSDYIIGATLYAVASYEVINILSMAMHNHIKYQQVRDQIYAHPTMSEALNDLFDTVAPL